MTIENPSDNNQLRTMYLRGSRSQAGQPRNGRQGLESKNCRQDLTPDRLLEKEWQKNNSENPINFDRSRAAVAAATAATAAAAAAAAEVATKCRALLHWIKL